MRKTDRATLKDEAFVLCLDESEVSGNAGEDGAHAASNAGGV